MPTQMHNHHSNYTSHQASWSHIIILIIIFVTVNILRAAHWPGWRVAYFSSQFGHRVKMKEKHQTFSWR